MPSAAINRSAANSADLIAAPGADSFIRVHGYVFVAAGSVNVTLEDGDGNDFTGPIPCGTNTGVSVHYSEQGWFDCPVNKAFKMLLSGAVQVSGHVSYSIRKCG